MAGNRLLAFSDSHENIPALKKVIKWTAKSLRDPQSGDAIDAAVFLGDGIEDLNKCGARGFPCELIKIRGNIDYALSAPEARVLEFGGHRFFLCHGHRYNLHNDYHVLVAAARNTESDAVIFGHIHVPLVQNIDGMLLICPGSIGKPRSREGATFALIDCQPGEALGVEILQIDKL